MHHVKKPLDKVGCLNADEFQRLIFEEMLQIDQELLPDGDGAEPDGLIEDLLGRILGNLVIILVVPDLLQVTPLGRRARFRSLPEYGIPRVQVMKYGALCA